MGSRLQKLLKLLESNNDGTRKAASQQICEIAKAHPSQVVSITRKVHGLLYSVNWDTRIAAAATIGLLAEAFPHNSVKDLAGACAEQADAQQQAQLQDLQHGIHITLQSFDLAAVLSKGEPLLASGGQEFDAGDSSLSLAERVAKQREQIKKRLGLGKGLDDVLNTDELVNEEDITAALQPTPSKGRRGRGQQGQSSATPEKQAASELLGRSDSLSARERNKLKRKAKAMERQGSARVDNKGRVAELLSEQRMGGSRDVSPTGRGGSPTAAAAAAAAAGAVKALSDEQAAEQDQEEWHCVESGGWPFQRLADQLCCDVLSPVWTVRHGAAAGLRELLREQAAAAAVEAPLEDINTGWACAGNSGLRQLGPVAPAQVESAAIANAAWLEDVVTHLLCVLALDRFADYVSDQVVVPVRETAAQALAAALQATSLYSLQRVLELLACMYNHREWHVRHGAYTGIKYLLASRPEAVGDLLQFALPVLLTGLQDRDDSVQAAAAEALVPLAPMLLQMQADDTICWLRATLWTMLADMEEELSVATSSTLSLLAALYSPPAVLVADADLAAQLPILWPFLSHTLTSVRVAAATCLASVAAAMDAGAWAAAAAAAATAMGGDAAAVAAATAAALAAAGAPTDHVPEAGLWLQPVVGPCLRMLLQCLVMEKAEPVRQLLLHAWRALLQHSRAADVAAGLTARDMRAMLNLLCTPCGQALDSGALVVPLQRRLVPWSSQDHELSASAARPAKRAKASPASSRGMNGVGGSSSQGSAGGAGVSGCSVDPEAWPGMSDPQAAVHTRLLASRAIAELCDKVTGQEPPVLPGLVLQQLQQLAASSRVGAALVILQWLLLVAGRLRKATSSPGPSSAASAAAADTAAAVAASSVQLAAQIACCVPEQLPDSCLAYLGAPGPSTPSPPAAEPYTELNASYAQMRRELYALMNVCLEVGLPLPLPDGLSVEAVTPDACLAIAAAVPAEVDLGNIKLAKTTVQSTAAELQVTEVYYHTSSLLVLASTVVAGGRLPAKLNCVIQNLMAGLRREPMRELQSVAAEALAELMVGCAARQPCPNDKLVKNLCSMLCGDPTETPSAAAAEGASPDDDILAARVLSHSQASTSGPAAGSTTRQPRNSSNTGSPTRKAQQQQQQQQQPQQPAPDTTAVTARVGAEAALKAVCERFGAGLFEQLPSLWQHMSAALAGESGEDGAPGGDPQALIHAVQVVKAVFPALHGSLLPQGLQLLPALCGCLRHSNAAVRLAAARCLATLAAAQPEATLPLLLKQAAPLLEGTHPLPCRLGAVEVMAALMQQLQRQLVPYTVLLVVPLLRRMSDPVAAVRRRAALCFGGLTALLPLAQGLPLPAGLDEAQRRAAEQDAEFLSQLLDNKRVEDYSLPVVLKVELRRYQQEGINWLSFLRRFGLSGVLADDMGLGKTLQATTIMACSAAERQARAVTVDGSQPQDTVQQPKQEQQQQQQQQQQVAELEQQEVKQEQVELKIEPQESLQQAGTDGQPGGETLVQQQPEQQQQQVKLEQEEQQLAPMNSNAQQKQPQAAEQKLQQPQQLQQPVLLPSLVVCPSTLVGHWAHEINKYVEPSVLRPLPITGTPAERAAAERRLQGPEGFNVAVISYEALRSDVDWAAGVMWDYVILDEGHVIRSTKSKLSQAVKRLQAQHRLVLSGTPIQNSALELWSLFDFLMPGFLGAERDFQARFGKLVAAARYSKKDSKEAEAGMLALDALHKQVMPFILRRTKAQVLQDLPPKIITDVLCKLSAIQHALYEDFQDSQALSEVKSTLAAAVAADGGSNGGSGAGDSSRSAAHVFSSLLYLRKLCSHPLLVLDWSVAAHREACQEVLGVSTQAAAEVALRAIEHAPKLCALQDILVQCGIVNGQGSSAAAAAAAAESELSEGSTDSGHRLLVFAQLKGMLDLVDSLLLQPLGVSSLRLDGSVEAAARFGVVQRFNTDPTIQVLLLTTHVGGLGLNLTSADTVVFLEHDWNPMKDLQAMDRAHRIGQTRTVNVYRLLMQDTLEERIMSLQQFKLDVANAVVNSDNVSMAAMDTGQLLDLFGAPTTAAEAAAKQEQRQAAAAAALAAGDTAGIEAAAAAAAGQGKKKSALQSMLEGMGELWDDSQYHSEFDMKAFTEKLTKTKQSS